MKTYTFASPGTDLARHVKRNHRGRDLVVGDIRGHFGTLRHALAELEVGKDDRLFSLGDLVDRGPDSWSAKSWIAGPRAPERFKLVCRSGREPGVSTPDISARQCQVLSRSANQTSPPREQRAA